MTEPPTKASAPKCRNCSQPIEWIQAPNARWLPLNPKNRSDHRETCRALDPDYRRSIKDKNHDFRVRAFFQNEKRKRLQYEPNYLEELKTMNNQINHRSDI